MACITEELSPKQKFVLELAWDGLSVKETAAAMGLTWKTVKNYRELIYRKWHVRNVEGMLRQGVERGYLAVTSRSADWPGRTDLL